MFNAHSKRTTVRCWGLRSDRAIAVLPAVLVVALGLACAGILSPAAATAGGSIRVTIVGQNHHPRVGKKWTYTVNVTNARGQRLSGTETTHYLYNGSVVGTEKPVNVRFSNGSYHDTISFPAAAVGSPLTVQAVVKTSQGSGSAGWSIEVVR